MFSQILQSAARRPYRQSISLLAARWLSSEVSQTGWVSTVEEGVQLAKKENKPIMLIIHRHWCKACKELIPMVKNNADISTFNKKFITVEMTGNDDKEEENYAPDGLYVPRILFMNSSGKLLVNIRNESNNTGTNMYVYSNPSDLLNSMKKALK